MPTSKRCFFLDSMDRIYTCIFLILIQRQRQKNNIQFAYHRNSAEVVRASARAAQLARGSIVLPTRHWLRFGPKW